MSHILHAFQLAFIYEPRSRYATVIWSYRYILYDVGHARRALGKDESPSDYMLLFRGCSDRNELCSWCGRSVLSNYVVCLARGFRVLAKTHFGLYFIRHLAEIFFQVKATIWGQFQSKLLFFKRSLSLSWVISWKFSSFKEKTFSRDFQRGQMCVYQEYLLTKSASLKATFIYIANLRVLFVIAEQPLFPEKSPFICREHILFTSQSFMAWQNLFFGDISFFRRVTAPAEGWSSFAGDNNILS